jgi:hypothetical protein
MPVIAPPPTGQHWDCVQAPWRTARLAPAALDIHGERRFAILNDPATRTISWLVPLGTAARWDVPLTSALTAPSASRSPTPPAHGHRACTGSEFPNPTYG